MQNPKKIPPPGVRLIRMDLDEAHECAILRAQRVICGWKIEIAQKVREQMAKGLRALYWIALPADPAAVTAYKGTTASVAELPTITRRNGDAGGGEGEKGGSVYVPIGHISLDQRDWPDAEELEPELSLTSPDGTVLTITTLFVSAVAFFDNTSRPKGRSVGGYVDFKILIYMMNGCCRSYQNSENMA